MFQVYFEAFFYSVYIFLKFQINIYNWYLHQLDAYFRLKKIRTQKDLFLPDVRKQFLEYSRFQLPFSFVSRIKNWSFSAFLSFKYNVSIN